MNEKDERNVSPKTWKYEKMSPMLKMLIFKGVKKYMEFQDGISLGSIVEINYTGFVNERIPFDTA